MLSEKRKEDCMLILENIYFAFHLWLFSWRVYIFIHMSNIFRLHKTKYLFFIIYPSMCLWNRILWLFHKTVLKLMTLIFQYLKFIVYPNNHIWYNSILRNYDDNSQIIFKKRNYMCQRLTKEFIVRIVEIN